MLNPFRWIAAQIDRVGFTGTQRLEIADLIQVGLEVRHMRMIEAAKARRAREHALTAPERREAEVADLIAMLADEGWDLRIHGRPGQAKEALGGVNVTYLRNPVRGFSAPANDHPPSPSPAA